MILVKYSKWYAKEHKSEKLWSKIFHSYKGVKMA